MAKPQTDPKAKRPHETFTQWRMRVIAMEQEQRDKDEPIVPIEAQRHGDYRAEWIMHVESATLAKPVRNRVSRVVDKWLDEGSVGFGEGARTAIDRCHHLWEAMPLIGKQAANYNPPTSRGTLRHEDIYGMDAQNELRHLFRDIPEPYTRVFENVVRWGNPAGQSASAFFSNDAQAIASAKTIVGMVASLIAAREGY